MRKFTKFIKYGVFSVGIFAFGVLVGFKLKVNYIAAPTFEMMAIGVTDSMYKSALHLQALHTGNAKIFNDLLVQDVKDGLAAADQVEKYMVTDWGKETLKQRKTDANKILDCVEREWEPAACN